MDISLCTNKNCHLRGDCLRYLAAPGRRQSYIQAAPVGDACSMQIKRGEYTCPVLSVAQVDLSHSGG